jgi:uncharacterized protein
MTDVDFPFRIDSRGRTGLVSGDGHIRDLIEQVLFTSRGERVNRPSLGCGLLQLVFQPNSEPLELAVQATVQAALHQWLGDRIAVEKVEVRADDSVLQVRVGYMVRSTQEVRIDEFRSAP